MLSPRKLTLYLFGGIAVFTGFALVFRDGLIPVLLAVGLGCVLVDGLIEGRLSFGQGKAKRAYRRRADPIAYWSIVTGYCVVILALLAVAAFGERREISANKLQNPEPSAVSNQAER